jgi:OST-HTH/LOTUS domain
LFAYQGQLAESFFATVIVPDGFERDLLPEDKTPTDRMSMAFSFRIAMEPERWVQTKAAIKELVAMRNDLVHHLIERFDVWDDEGCLMAIRHLEASHERVVRHYQELVDVANKFDAVRIEVAAFVQSEPFREMLFAPDASFEWPHAGIVSVLREATRIFAVDDWTRLDEVRTWIAEKHPDQTPEKYDCRSWQQVISESRQFDLRYLPGNDGHKVAWFRERK